MNEDFPVPESAEILVIGGSVAGLTTATVAKRYYPDKSVVIIRRDSPVPIPCGIPYLFGTIGAIEKNLVPDAVLDFEGIELVEDTVVAIDRGARKVTLSAGSTIAYEKLVLATGSTPAVPPIPGADKKNVFVIRKNIEALGEFLAVLKAAQDVVIIGGGFIGVEFAEEICRHSAKNVTIVEVLPHCLALSFDEPFCVAAEKELTAAGVKILTNQKVAEITGGGKVSGVRLSSGEEVKADMVLISAGVRPNVELAVQAGLKADPATGIWVDRAMRTEDPHIFACGDCAAKTSFFTGKTSFVRLASVATMEARTVVANLYTIRRENPGAIGVASTVVGKLTLGAAGLTEELARREGFAVLTSEASSPNRHPKAMPGMRETRVKLVFEKNSGKILGGQVLGGESAGELINVIAACILNRMTYDQIALLQMGTHPLLTAAPTNYYLTVAAEAAAQKALAGK
uniref:Pyridine nucleotide-disulfide oxidoreductase n=1 Tax=Ammonifex degensii TaxID=42838 RepID=A0A7C1F2P4_9THEO